MALNVSQLARFAIVLAINLTVASPAALRAQDQKLGSQGPGNLAQADDKPTEADAIETAVRKQIDEFFTEYEAATRADTAEALVKLIDFEAFADLVLDQTQIEMPNAMRGLLVNRLLQATKQEFATSGEVWDRHRVIQTTVFQDGKTVEAFVRSWTDDVESSRNIFWLEKSDRWRIIDWFNVELGIRNSTLVSSVMRETHDTRQSKESIRTLELLNQLFVAARQQDIESAQDVLDSVTGRSVPNSLEGLRWIVQASVSLYYDPLATLESLDKAEAFEPEAVLADFLRLRAYFELGEHQQAIHHAERYLNRFGADDFSYLIKGLAHAELGQLDEALAAYEAGLEDNPQSLDLIIQYVSTLPEVQKTKIADFFRALPDLMQSFEYLADQFEADEEYTALKVLLDTAASMDEEVPHREYYQSIVLQGQGEPGAAMENLITASSRLDADDDYRAHYEYAICRAAVQSSQVMRAYDTCQEQVACFRSLLSALRVSLVDEHADVQVRSDTEAMIKELVAKHLMTYGTDSETFMILGDQAYYYAEDQQTAIEYYDLALKYYQNDDTPDSILYNAIDCHIQTKSIVAYYQSSDFKRRVYEIAKYRVPMDSEEFKEFEQLHRSNFPNLPEFVMSQMKTLYGEKRYQAAVDASDRVEDQEEGNSYFMAQIQFVRALCLARLGKNDDAILSARRLDEEYRDRARATIFAIRNDRNGFRGAVQRLIDSGYELESEEFAAWVDVPEAWLEGLVTTGSDDEAPTHAIDFAQYNEIRRLVFLANEPIAFDMLSIREAAAEVGLSIFEIRREQLLTEQENFVCALSDDAVMVSAQGCKFFLLKRKGKFLNQFSSAGVEWDENDETLQVRVSEHTAWFSIDVFAWPQGADREWPSAIPEDAVRNMIRLAEIVLGGKATVAIHADGSVAVVCDRNLFDRLRASPRLESFHPADAVLTD